MRAGTFIIILFLLLSMLVGQQVKEASVVQGRGVDIHEITMKFNWDELTNLTENIKVNTTSSTDRLSNVVIRFADFVGFVGFESMKAGIEFGFEHPEYDFKFLMNSLIVIIIAGLIFSTFPGIFYILAIPIILIMWVRSKLKRRKNETKMQLKET